MALGAFVSPSKVATPTENKFLCVQTKHLLWEKLNLYVYKQFSMSTIELQKRGEQHIKI